MKKQKLLIIIIILLTVLLALESVLLYRSFNPKTEEKFNEEPITEPEVIPEEEPEEKKDDTVYFDINVEEETELIYSPGGNKGYRYGPSIMKHDDGTMDMWMSRPGNNSTQWDYIAYMHYDGDEWSEEEVVLWPTPGSKDACSVCDPAVIYMNGYYYLGYTATSSYELEGMNNSAFVARSKYPDGPYEKWDGASWGGDPEPIIFYDHDPRYWGIGELSFVADDEDLFIYYTFVNDNENCIRIAKADLTEDWPATVRLKQTVSYRKTEDSYDVVYAENLNTYVAFSIRDRMNESSYLVMFTSPNGKEFKEVGSVKENIMDYAHNMGIAKDETGHIRTDETLTIGYAYGKEWGSWSMILQDIHIEESKD